MTGNFEETVLQMYLQGISTRKIERVTGKRSGVQISKDAVSRIEKRLGEELTSWQGRMLKKTYPYMYLYAMSGDDASPMKAIWAGAAEDVAALTAFGEMRRATGRSWPLRPLRTSAPNHGET
jgi:hypothetical protein